MAGTAHRQGHRIQVSLVAGLGPPMPECLGIGSAALAALLPDRCVGAPFAGEQEFLHVAAAETRMGG